MRSRNHILIVFSLFAALCLLLTHNASGASLKERMLERVPAINALKDKGLIGENNQGYLEYRTGDQPEKKLIADENADRKTVYATIAKQQKVEVGHVGSRRAKQIADKGAAGHWYQKPDGSWYKK